MRTYIIEGKQEDLEAIMEREEFSVLFASKYVPMIAVQSEYQLEELQEKLPEYSIRQPKEYNIDR